MKFSVPKLNLKEDLELETPRVNNSHQVREVDRDEDLSWGTPLQEISNHFFFEKNKEIMLENSYKILGNPRKY